MEVHFIPVYSLIREYRCNELNGRNEIRGNKDYDSFNAL